MGKDKGRLPPFVPLLVTTLDSRAWRQLSHGARSLYVALKRRVPRGRNTAFISYRNAQRELPASPRDIAGWFKELQHYGFIVLHKHGCLGVEGKGKAPRWRLTELGCARNASADGLLEPPSNDFLKWDGIPFEKKKQPRSKWLRGRIEKQKPATTAGNGALPPQVASPLPTQVALREASATNAGSIRKPPHCYQRS
jgi:hypothetical protein